MKVIKFRAWETNIKFGYKMHGYQYRQAKYHPNANKRGYVLEHKLIMENHLGVYLSKDSVVHHKNGIRNDNRIENLEFFQEQSIHAKHHDTGKRNKNGQFVAESDDFTKKKYRLFNKNTGATNIFTLQKLISTTFRRSQFEYRGEWTGLKDNTRNKEFPNGKEIYEGDIVKVKAMKSIGNYNTIVIYKHQGFTLKRNDTYLINDSCLKVGIEIIGNIHENPELLDK